MEEMTVMAEQVEAQTAKAIERAKAPARLPRRLRRKLVGGRLNRTLVYIDQVTKDELRAMSQATGLSQIVLANIAIRSLASSDSIQDLAAQREGELAASGVIQGEGELAASGVIQGEGAA